MDFLKDFGLNPLLLAAQVVNFLLLLFILKKFLYQPILKVLEERKKKIEESVKNAEEIEIRLQKTNEKIDKMMAKASEEAQKIIQEAQTMKDQIIDEARKQAAKETESIFKKEQEKIKFEREKMITGVRDEIGILVSATVSKLLGKTMPKNLQKEIIEKEVKNLS